MAGIYKYAECNLSASGFDSGMDGFLSKRKYTDLSLPHVHIDWGIEKNSQLRRYSGKDVFIAESEGWHQLWTASLFSRAWVLQEQMLVCYVQCDRCDYNG
jgi:hypothetical protein